MQYYPNILVFCLLSFLFSLFGQINPVCCKDLQKNTPILPHYYTNTIVLLNVFLPLLTRIF